MAQYLINYLMGETETITADGIEYDPDSSDYTFTGVGGIGVKAIIPAANVLSIIRQDPEAADPCGAPAGALCVHDVSGTRKAVD